MAALAAGTRTTRSAGGATSKTATARTHRKKRADPIKYVWKVKGNELKVGENRTLKITGLSEVTFGGEAHKETYSVECPVIGLENGKISGSAPGTDEETLSFMACKVKGKEAECAIENKEFKSENVKSEIVEGVGASKEKALVKFVGAGEFLFKFHIIAVGSETCNVEGFREAKGSLLAEVKKEKMEESPQVFLFEPAEPKSFKGFGKACAEPAGLIADLKPFTVAGKIELELNPIELWGPF